MFTEIPLASYLDEIPKPRNKKVRFDPSTRAQGPQAQGRLLPNPD